MSTPWPECCPPTTTPAPSHPTASPDSPHRTYAHHTQHTRISTPPHSYPALAPPPVCVHSAADLEGNGSSPALLANLYLPLSSGTTLSAVVMNSSTVASTPLTPHATAPSFALS